jgi:hypothetical protein
MGGSMSSLGTGLYRIDDGWVMLLYKGKLEPMPRVRYVIEGYKPDSEQLPTKEAYEAAQKADDAHRT